jgi:hypothetical protein
VNAPLSAIEVGEITSGSDAFECVPYSCKMLARSCVERRTQVRAGINLIAFRRCRGCELGAQVEANSGVVIALDVVRKNGVPRLRGMRPSNHPSPPATRALAPSVPTPEPALAEPPIQAPAFSLPAAPALGLPGGTRDRGPQVMTERRAEVLRFIADYIGEHGYAPTLREIGTGANLGSTNAVCDHLSRLERDGWIHRSGAGKSRALVLSEKAVEAGFGEVGRTHTPGLGAEIEAARAEIQRLHALLSTPHITDFLEAVRTEAAHQYERWGIDHDAGKTAEDWSALVTYLHGKAIRAHFKGDREKLLHHIITVAAVCLNWHAHLNGKRSGGQANGR